MCEIIIIINFFFWGANDKNFININVWNYWKTNLVKKFNKLYIILRGFLFLWDTNNFKKFKIFNVLCLSN